MTIKCRSRWACRATIGLCCIPGRKSPPASTAGPLQIDKRRAPHRPGHMLGRWIRIVKGFQFRGCWRDDSDSRKPSVLQPWGPSRQDFARQPLTQLAASAPMSDGGRLQMCLSLGQGSCVAAASTSTVIVPTARSSKRTAARGASLSSVSSPWFARDLVIVE